MVSSSSSSGASPLPGLKYSGRKEASWTPGASWIRSATRKASSREMLEIMTFAEPKVVYSASIRSRPCLVSVSSLRYAESWFSTWTQFWEKREKMIRMA